MTNADPYDNDDPNGPGWSILELMGHRRLGGYVTQQELAGASLLRIDVPGPDGATIATQYYAPAALYCLTPCTEETARAVAARNQPEPAHRWELAPPQADRHQARGESSPQRFTVHSTPDDLYDPAEHEPDDDDDDDDDDDQEHDTR